MEVVVAKSPAQGGSELSALLESALDPLRVTVLPERTLAVWRPNGDPKSSLSRLFESHGLMWLQPLQVQGGWERYDLIEFEVGGANRALATLRENYDVRVIQQSSLEDADLLHTLFQSMGPLLDAPTPKQREALVAAYEQGYYESPRGTTTRDVAATLGLARSSFEERLRAAENRVMQHVGQRLQEE